MKKIKSLSTLSVACSLAGFGISVYNFNGAMSMAAGRYGQVAYYGASSIPVVISIAGLVLGLAAKAALWALDKEDKESD